MESELIKRLKELGYTLSVCESLTGGMLCSTLCGVSGASAVVKGGFITYTNEMKQLLADVPAETLEEYTAVSEETAYAMAEGCARKCGTEIGLSLTGYAGPDGDDVGKVCFGIHILNFTVTYTAHFQGDRQSIREQSVKDIIEKAYDALTFR